MKIYTKTGDAGETSLFDKSRVSKADDRVDAYGEVDELNAALGAARAAGLDDDLSGAIETIQKELFAVGARLADPTGRIAGRACHQRRPGVVCALPVALLQQSEAAVEAGATAVIQPGGSIRDEEVIAAADDAGLAMIFTGMRHFRH